MGKWQSGGSWLFSPETGDTETLKKSPGTPERMASLDKTNTGLEKSRAVQEIESLQRIEINITNPQTTYKYFGWIQNVTQMFDFYFNW